MAAAIAILPNVALGGVFIAPEGATVDVRVQRAFIRFEGGRETLTEELEVLSTAREMVWIRSMPTAKAIRGTANKELLPALADLTLVSPPHNEQIRNMLFGPSVVTVLTRKVAPAQKIIRDPLDISTADRTLELVDTIALRDPIPTSTITALPILPTAMLTMFARTRTELPSHMLFEIAGLLESDNTIFVSILRDARPSTTGVARVPAERYDFTHSHAVYPLRLSEDRSDTDLRIYTLAPAPLAPVSIEAVWLREPWETIEKQNRVYYVAFNNEVQQESPLEFELAERHNVPLTATPHLMRANIRLGAGEKMDLELVQAPEPILLPGPGSRGTPSDLFTCVLLGLTPLLYTPESWFLLWLNARAKARARREGKAFGVRLWSFYAILVGAFWFFALDQNARIAALVPVLIGLVQLAVPFVERDPLPVRSIFRKKKK